MLTNQQMWLQPALRADTRAAGTRIRTPAVCSSLLGPVHPAQSRPKTSSPPTTPTPRCICSSPGMHEQANPTSQCMWKPARLQSLTSLCMWEHA